MIDGFYLLRASQIARPTGQAYGGQAWIFFMFFLVLVSLGLLNLLTAVFIESLLEESRQRETKDVQEEGQKRREVLELIRGLFDTFDIDSNGVLDEHELAKVTKSMKFLDTRVAVECICYCVRWCIGH